MPEIAATMYGATIDDPLTSKIAVGRRNRCRRSASARRSTTDTFDDRVRIGSAMNLTEAVHYAQHHINAARQLET